MAREIGHYADTSKDSDSTIYNTYLDQSNKSQEISTTPHSAQQLQQKQLNRVSYKLMIYDSE